MASRAEKWAEKFIRVLGRTTVKVVHLDPTGMMPDNEGSGFIIPAGSGYTLISAAHTLNTDGWLLETGVSQRGATLMLPLNGAQWTELQSVDVNDGPVELDMAWCRLDLDAVSTAMKDGKLNLDKGKLELPLYRGPLDGEPEEDVPYGFVSWRHSFFHQDARWLERELVVEFGMRFVGFDERLHLYRFELADTHKGHQHYRGVSGAPIADPTGRIVSLVARGDIETNSILGFPIGRYTHLFDVP